MSERRPDMYSDCRFPFHIARIHDHLLNSPGQKPKKISLTSVDVSQVANISRKLKCASLSPKCPWQTNFLVFE